ncbi:MAG TPA: DUF6152 family protein [Verrucomicrobiae bacterium]|jgi:hypothetical protein|nr:DUF6152 family protein [Verrucomicrobiae bacterium]
MRGLPIFALAIAAGPLLVPLPAPAHHGTTAYDFTRTLTLKGTVTRFDWVNPHASLEWDAKTDNGGVEHWVVELTSPGMLTRSGWHHDSVKVGDEVTVYFHPSKNGTKFGLFQRVAFADGRPNLIDPRAP